MKLLYPGTRKIHANFLINVVPYNKFVHSQKVQPNNILFDGTSNEHE